MTDARSRQGCIKCRTRRRKCDEGQPSCMACQKRGLHCEYRVKLRWASNDIPATFKGRRRRVSTKPTGSVEILGISSANSNNSTDISDPLIDPSICHESSTVQDDVSLPQLVESVDTSLIEDDCESEADGSHASPEEMAIEEESWVLDDEQFGGVDLAHFNSPSEGIAFRYWFKYLSGILPAYDGAQNPYRRLSVLALASPVLLNTIISLATEYMYCHGHMSAELTIKRHDLALSSLREALVATDGVSDSITTNSELSPKQATLAAVLLQIANVVFVGGNGVDVHLTCALHFLQDLDYIRAPVTDFIPRLLIQRFAMVDVMTSIIRRRRLHLPADCWIFTPSSALDITEPSFREMTGCPQPVLGFLARISCLAADLAEEKRDKWELLDKVSTLETDMRIYARSRVTIAPSSDRNMATQHLDTLSQCFYWSAHLILQRRVYHDPIGSPRVQKTVMTIIRLMKSMPVGCGPDSSLPLPFYLASREAISETDRDWVRSRSLEMKSIYPGKTKDAMMAITEEIWREIDKCREVGEQAAKSTEDAVTEVERRNDICIF